MHVQITQKQIKSYYTEAEKIFAITPVSLLHAVLTQTTVNTEHPILGIPIHLNSSICSKTKRLEQVRTAIAINNIALKRA